MKGKCSFIEEFEISSFFKYEIEKALVNTQGELIIIGYEKLDYNNDFPIMQDVRVVDLEKKIILIQTFLKKTMVFRVVFFK